MAVSSARPRTSRKIRSFDDGEVADFAFRDGDALGFHTSAFTAIPNAPLGSEDLI